MLRKAPRGTRSVLRQAQKVTQISDQHAATLYRRTATGQGAVVDVSLLSAGMWVASPAVVASRLYDIDTIPRMRHADLPNALVAAYATRDRRLIYLAGIQTEGHFENFCEVIDRQDLLKAFARPQRLIDDPRS